MIIRGSMDLGPMNAVFGTLKNRANDFRKPFTEVGQRAREDFSNRFEQEGPGWKPNARGTETLVKTGALRDSFNRKGAPGNLSAVGAAEAQFGSNLPYAAIVQTGGETTVTTAKGKSYRMTLPARPIVVEPNAVFVSQIGSIAKNHFSVKAGDQ